jgi:hypothetical protein
MDWDQLFQHRTHALLEHGNEPLVSVKGNQFSDELRDLCSIQAVIVTDGLRLVHAGTSLNGSQFFYFKFILGILYNTGRLATLDVEVFILEAVCGETENKREKQSKRLWMHDIFVIITTD